MLIRYLLLSIFSPLFIVVFASSPHEQILGQILLTNQTVPLDLSTRVTLGGKNGYEQLGLIHGPEQPREEYYFSFSKPLPTVPGNYVLRIESRKYEFQSYFIKVNEDERVEVGLFDEKSLKMLPGTWLPLPLIIHPLRLYPLKNPSPQSLSLFQILQQNPLIWLLALGLIFMLAIPKLMENLDPETLKEVRESQKEMHQNMASLQSFDSSKISKFLAGGGGSSATSETDTNVDSIPDLTTVKPRGSNNSGGGSTTGVNRNGGGGGGKSKKRK
ncbi:hypothetical protein JCM5350_004384 [Sporobolomyces pararoseus]